MVQTTTPVTAQPLQISPAVLRYLQTEEGLVLLGAVGLLLLLQLFGNGSNKNKVARGRWAGAKEKSSATKLALAQRKAKKHNAVSLYLGTPTAGRKPMRSWLDKLRW
jgi:hypothetical protein